MAAGRAGAQPLTADAWDRWDRLWHGLFFVALAVPTALVVVDPEVAPDARAGTAALAAGFALCHWLGPVRHPEWADQLRPMAAYLVVAGAFTFLLLGRDRTYFFMIYGLYPQVFFLPLRWGIVGALLLTVLVFVRSGAFDSGTTSETVLSIVGSTALAIMIGLFIHAIAQQSMQRQAAIEALEAARSDLAEASRRAGVLEERQRLARELHDTLAQGFTSIVMLLEAAEQALPASAQTARGYLDKARRTARDSLGDVRRSVHALRPEVLETAALPEALADTVDRWSAASGVHATARTIGASYPLHPDAEVGLLRTAQEALANVRKHAGAHQVTVTLSYMDDRVSLDVNDDGVGFDPASLPVNGHEHGGFGLTGIRERVSALGGRLLVESAPDSGTTVMASVPRRDAEERLA